MYTNSWGLWGYLTVGPMYRFRGDKEFLVTQPLRDLEELGILEKSSEKILNRGIPARELPLQVIEQEIQLSSSSPSLHSSDG